MELKGREIFATGKWNEIEFTESDLDDIITNFDKLIETHKVPLKFGHDADHNVPDGQPAIGWVSRVYKVGTKLLADFSDMPRTVFEAIKNKLYRTISIELLFNVDNDGNKFNHVLDAVALLGADHPAVSGLADLDALLAKRTRFAGGHKLAFATMPGMSKYQETITQEDFAMDKKEVDDLISKALDPLTKANDKLVADLAAANSQIVTFKREKADADQAAEQKAIKLARTAVTEVLDTAVRQKTLTPAVRDTYSKQIGVDDDDRVVLIKLDEVKAMFSVQQVEDGSTGKETDDDVSDDPEVELMTLTRKCQQETGESDFAKAYKLTCAANPKLHKAYLDSNGEK